MTSVITPIVVMLRVNMLRVNMLSVVVPKEKVSFYKLVIDMFLAQLE